MRSVTGGLATSPFSLEVNGSAIDYEGALAVETGERSFR